MTAPLFHDAALDARFGAAKGVADAVLYEGYVLYPYRASSKKNQLRWQFGVVAPRAFVAAGGAESSTMRTEVIVETRSHCRLQVRVRALQVQARTIEALDGAAFEGQGGGDGYLPVATLDAGGAVWATFDEAVERQADLVDIDLDVVANKPRVVEIALPEAREVSPIVDDAGRTVGRAVRTRSALAAQITVGAEMVDGPYPLTRVWVVVDNLTDWAGPATSHDDVVRRSLVAVHLLAAVDGGRFVSLLDPPRFAEPAVAACTNTGTFPVLVGDPGADDVVLSSPIILYDHPAVAPESEGDMFDATEIDEILALRVLTLTDDEKREARATDPRSAAIIDRCDAMTPEAFSALHGTFRDIRSLHPEVAAPLGADGSAPWELAPWEQGPWEQAPSDQAPSDQAPSDQAPWWDPAVDASFDPWTDTVDIGAATVGKGSRVRLHPSRRSDAQDFFIDGKLAEVAGVFHEVDGGVYLAVVVDDDPAAELHQWHGRYLYFHPDEVEVLR